MVSAAPLQVRRRLAVARFWYEGNAFTPVPCRMQDFVRKEWAQGAEALARAAGKPVELAAVAAFAQAHPSWDVVALRCASAMPGGPIEESVFQQLEADILSGLTQGNEQAPWDAIYLSLHGAGITTERQTPELDLVRAIRARFPQVPIGASFDLHGNLSQEFGELINMACGYKTYPHVDQYAVAERVLTHLEQMIEEGARSRVLVHKPGIVLASHNMRTASGPMAELQQLAARAVQPPILEASIFGGFPYADTVDTGTSVVITYDLKLDPDGEAARQVALELSQAIRQSEPEFQIKLPTPQEGLDKALQVLRDQGGLVAVTDPGDNPASGGACDTTGLFKTVLGTPFSHACVFASFADEQVVNAAHTAGAGGVLDTHLGGRYGGLSGAPVPVRVVVERLTNGEFHNTGPKETGMHIRCGRTAVLSLVERPHIQIIVTEAVVPANDPGFFALHGIDLALSQLLCVKAKNHFRAAFVPLCTGIIDVDAPGPAALDLNLLPFKNARL